MKLGSRHFLIAAFLALGGILLTSCGDDDSTGPVPVESLVPVLTTASINTITRSSAESGGEVTSDNGFFVTARGVCWSTSPMPTLANSHSADGDNVGTFTSVLTGLARNTRYYLRAYASNSEGTGYGSTMSFTTLDSAYTLTDFDGNQYQALSIGTQVWMTENLRVTHYRNGDALQSVTDNTEWETIQVGAYCSYDNNPQDLPIHGLLYNSFAIEDSRNIAPNGWHVPSSEDWGTLVEYLGGELGAGGKLKQDVWGWDAPNTGATNESGFSALASGSRRHPDGIFRFRTLYAFFWHTTPLGQRMLFYNDAGIGNGYESGGSIRCIKD